MELELALETINVDRRAQLEGAILEQPVEAEFKLKDIYEGWDDVQNPGTFGKAFRRLVAEGFFPMVLDLGGVDGRNHARYVRT